MRSYNWILILLFWTSLSAFSQDDYIEHQVSKGETISQIAAHYNIKSSAIYDLNPDSRKGIKFKSILLIPTLALKTKFTVSSIDTTYPEKKHTVLSKETLYGIARQYGVTVEDLNKLNPILQKSGLKKGDKIRIPGTESNQNSAVSFTESIKETQKNTVSEKKVVQKEEATLLLKSNEIKEPRSEVVVREILPQETKYSIAKQYKITVAELDAVNPILEREVLKIGQNIIIPVKEENNVPVAAVQKEIKKESEAVVLPLLETKNVISGSSIKKEGMRQATIAADKPSPNSDAVTVLSPIVNGIALETEVIREVLAKETKYGIAKEYGISVKELERQNPNIIRGLAVGYKLNIRSKKTVESIALKDTTQSTEESISSSSNYSVKSFHSTDFLDQLVSSASENIGARYRMGGTTKDGFDCSGLMCTTFSNFDIQLPRTSIEQSQYGIKINNEDAQKGDLIFFKTNGRRQINHVGMVVEAIDGDIKFIHASVSGGVMISSVKEKYYKKKLTQINRVL
jgi:cell wall-associated NlpC family hydrolase/DNA-directed RNA polymerase subunit H (RpoH/RPB5)